MGLFWDATCHMREQSSTLSKPLLASVVPALALLAVATVAYAGDPIQVSGDKSKPGPVDARPVDADIFKSLNKSKGPVLKGLNQLVVPSQAVDPQEERRLKNARDEKKNWMLLEPGELQKRDDEEQSKFGGRSVPPREPVTADRGLLGCGAATSKHQFTGPLARRQI